MAARGGRVRELAGGWLAAVLVLAPATAKAEAQRVHIWYRHTEGCPDGSEFLARLQGLGREAALAQVGDRVDFVVSLALAPAHSSGRLERQSDGGTVAIRELTAPHCAEVAEGLALSLELALQPSAEAQPAQPGADVQAAASSPAESEAGPPPERGTLWQVGVQGSMETGLAGAALPGGALFAELGSASAGPRGRLSLRATYGSGDADVQVTLLTSRAELCAAAWNTAQFSLGPCAGAELGVLDGDSSAPGGQHDRGLWASGVGHARGAWRVGESLSVEAQLGVVVPFVRYRFRSELGRELSESAAIGLQAALGAAFVL
jgi:hypothetical protein